MPIPTHQTIIRGFIQALVKDHKEHDDFGRIIFDEFEKSTNTSFKDIATQFIKSIIDFPDDKYQYNLPAILIQHLTDLKLSKDEWHTLCQRDFSVTLSHSDRESAMTIYSGHLIGVIAIELSQATFASSFSFKVRNSVDILKGQIIEYLNKFNTDLWSQAYLSDLLYYRSSGNEQQKEIARNYKKAVLEANQQTQQTVHPGLLAYFHCFTLQGEHESAAKLIQIETNLERCNGPALRFFPTKSALHLVTNNYLYICYQADKSDANIFHYQTRFGLNAPLAGLDAIQFSPEIVAKAIKWTHQALIVSNLHCWLLCFLVYMAHIQNNKQAQNALKSIFSDYSIPFSLMGAVHNLSSEIMLFREIHDLYKKQDKASRVKLLQICELSTYDNEDPQAILEKIAELTSQNSNEAREAILNLKRNIFKLLANFFETYSKKYNPENHYFYQSQSFNNQVHYSFTGMTIEEYFGKISAFFKNLCDLKDNADKKITRIPDAALLSKASGSPIHTASTLKAASEVVEKLNIPSSLRVAPY